MLPENYNPGASDSIEDRQGLDYNPPTTDKSSLYLCMFHLNDKQSRQLDEVCREHLVTKLYLFGSAVGSGFDPQRSDVDLAVEFSDALDPIDFADNFFSLRRALEQLFGRKVDLLSYRALKNPVIKEEIEKHKVSLYAA